MSSENPDFAAPSYTIVETRLEGLKQITTVLMDGVFETFEANIKTVRAGAGLASQEATDE